MRQSSYIIQKASGSYCNRCLKPVDLLCDKDLRPRQHMFYICWNCEIVFEVGKSEVKREREDQNVKT